MPTDSFFLNLLWNCSIFEILKKTAYLLLIFANRWKENVIHTIHLCLDWTVRETFEVDGETHKARTGIKIVLK